MPVDYTYQITEKEESTVKESRGQPIKGAL